MKAFVRGGRAYLTADNRKLRPWRDAIVWRARQALAGRPMIIGPVEIDPVIRLPRPRGHFGRRGLRPSAPRCPSVRPDADKALRGVFDALTEASVWRDDAQVVRGSFVKVYCREEEAPGVRVEVREFDAVALVAPTIGRAS